MESSIDVILQVDIEITDKVKYKNIHVKKVLRDGDDVDLLLEQYASDNKNTQQLSFDFTTV